eukprot:2595131-Amphidinium_carterae.1
MAIPNTEQQPEPKKQSQLANKCQRRDMQRGESSKSNNNTTQISTRDMRGHERFPHTSTASTLQATVTTHDSSSFAARPPPRPGQSGKALTHGHGVSEAEMYTPAWGSGKPVLLRRAPYSVNYVTDVSILRRWNLILAALVWWSAVPTKLEP